jgi:hypothetical protein
VTWLARQRDVADLLGHEQPQQRRLDEDDARAGGPALPELAAVGHEHPLGSQRAHEFRERVVQDVVDLLDLHDVGWAVGILDDCLHRALLIAG